MFDSDEARGMWSALWSRERWLRRVALWGGAVALALLGVVFGAGAFGTGDEQARSVVQGHAVVGHEFGIMKFGANLVSYVAGIPGGLFSPALAVGADLGHNLSVLLPVVDPSSVLLLGMCASLTGVTQAPLTSAVISLELTANSDMMLPILATALVCRKPVYKAVAGAGAEPAAPLPSDGHAAAPEDAPPPTQPAPKP